MSFTLSFLSNPPRVSIIHTILHFTHSNHSFNCDSSITLLRPTTIFREREREREREGEREKEREKERGIQVGETTTTTSLSFLFFLSFLHFATRVVGEEAIATKASRPAPLLRTESYANAYPLEVQFNTLEKERKRKKESKAKESKAYIDYPIRKAQLSCRDHTILSIYISHLTFSHLTGTAGEIRVVAWVPSLTNYLS